jgi:hypothetical protein
MRGRRTFRDGSRRVTLELKTAACALGLVLVVAGSGSGATVRLSEGSHEVAYVAGLGDQHVAAVPVFHRLAKTPGRCVEIARPTGSSSVAFAALVKHVAVIRQEPQGRSAVVGRFGRFDENGFREVLGVIGAHSDDRCRNDWYRVQLPVLPNGATGWVRAWAVQTYRVRSRIEVDVSQHQLRLYRSGKLAFQTRVAVGSPATPTPLGRYFVNERYVLRDAGGPFGPYALGISAHSDVLQHVWVQDGPIGIHGTNEPWSVGQSASHGCIRVMNAVMRRLFPLAPAGTPVIVKA